MIYQEDLDRASENKEALQKKLKSFWKKNKRRLDDAFHEAHDEVFEEVDCMSCANCCKTTSPIFRDVDIKKMAKGMRIKEVQFIKDYLHRDEDDHMVLNSAPCPFLDLTDNACTQYKTRPQACNEYPHTNRKKMTQVLKLTEANLDICPAAVRIVEKINL